MAREIIWHCEGCSKPIREGDKYHAGVDVELCEQCAPSYGDMLAAPSLFRGSDDDAATPDEAKAICDAHVAAGGALSDKLLTAA